MKLIAKILLLTSIGILFLSGLLLPLFLELPETLIHWVMGVLIVCFVIGGFLAVLCAVDESNEKIKMWGYKYSC